MIRLGTILILTALLSVVAVMGATAVLLGRYGWEWPVIALGSIAAYLLYRVGKEVGDMAATPASIEAIEEDAPKFPEQW